jgi:DHA1 family inner membrane transport protein
MNLALVSSAESKATPSRAEKIIFSLFAVSKVMLGVSAGIVLGIPVASFIASAASLKIAMFFFAAANAAAFIATLLFVPSMPVKERLSYGTQLRVLKKPITWISLAVVAFTGSSIFAVYAYIAA